MVDDVAERLEGSYEPGRLVMVRFPDKATVKRWYESPEYQEFVQHRYAASRANFLVVAETAPDVADWVASEMARPAVR